jgi:dTDP-4-dehydrorhamnose reductase
MPRILLLGGSGYIGEAFQSELSRRRLDFVSLSRAAVDYTRFETLLSFLRDRRPDFVINAAGYTGKPNVDACESSRAETIAGNTLLPAVIAHACSVASVPWGHVSSGCIYSGGHVTRDGRTTIERDLMAPTVRRIWENDPTALRGFNETDEPNFCFRHPPCSFYSGTKALGEEAIAGIGSAYIWRLRIPFDEYDHERNYLTKLQRYRRLLQSVNSISHRADFVRACLDLWSLRAPYGIYNVTNPGWVTTRQVVARIQQFLPSGRSFEFFEDDAEFYATAAKTPRSNCVMDVTKLLSAGVRMRPIDEALNAALRNWQPAHNGVLVG